MYNLQFSDQNFHLSTEGDSRRIVCGLAAPKSSAHAVDGGTAAWSSCGVAKLIVSSSPELPSPRAAHAASRHVTSEGQDPR
jgi:hypothetical protein